jgi:polysaccharide pyruvyl transferase WcaK-like protein
MSRVALLGWYGRGNFGNEAIRQGIHRTLTTAEEDVVVEPYCLTYGEGAPAVDPRRASGLVDLLSDRDLATLNERFDLVIFGGGRLETLFHPLIRAHIGVEGHRRAPDDPTRRVLAQLDKITVRKIVHGVSFGRGRLTQRTTCMDDVIEATTARHRADSAELLTMLTQEVLPRFDAVSVRGRISQALLASVNPVLVPDPAFCLPVSAPAGSLRSLKSVAVCVKSDADAATLAPLTAFLDRLADDGWDVVFVPMCTRVGSKPHSDVTTSLAAMARMRAGRRASVLVPDRQSPSDLVKAFASMGLVVSMRLHGAILAGMAGCAVIPILTAEAKMLEVIDMMGIAANAVYCRELSFERLARLAASPLDRWDRDAMTAHFRRHQAFLAGTLSEPRRAGHVLSRSVR